MSRIHVVTLARLNRALARVVRELERHGFWDEALEDVDVFLVPIGSAYGWQSYGDGGEINIPALSLARLGDWWRGKYTSVADVLRHEYGHAIADTHRGLIRSRRFSRAFGSSHDRPSERRYDPEQHATPYAAYDTSEDFAETVMLFLKHDGRLPAVFRATPVQTRWRFVRNMGRAIRSGERRWY